MQNGSQTDDSDAMPSVFSLVHISAYDRENVFSSVSVPFRGPAIGLSVPKNECSARFVTKCHC